MMNGADGQGGAFRSAGRLGRNVGGYCGECIDIDHVVARTTQLAIEQGWESLSFLDQAGIRLVGLHRPAAIATAIAGIYVSAGIHGDEPATPLAVLRMFEEKAWPDDLTLWVCPCLNPTGFRNNTRENDKGIDLNRDYLDPRSQEILAHTRWLQGLPQFDLSICLHEDWESQGFYLYELCGGRELSIAPAIIEAVERVCPVDRSEVIEGRPAFGGIIRPQVDPRSRPDWPEAFHLTTHKTPISYTLEAPSDFPLGVRVSALAAALEAIFTHVRKASRNPGQIL